MILDGLFGNPTAEKVLLFLQQYETGYAGAIAQNFEIALSQVQKQLGRLELEGILSSRLVGRTRIYSFNPRYRFTKKLRELLAEGIGALPKSYQEKYFRNRSRPRRAGKPLP